MVQHEYILLTVGLAVDTTIEAKGDPVGASVGFRGDWLGLEVGCSDENDANKIKIRKVSVKVSFKIVNI